MSMVIDFSRSFNCANSGSPQSSAKDGGEGARVIVSGGKLGTKRMGYADPCLARTRNRKKKLDGAHIFNAYRSIKKCNKSSTSTSFETIPPTYLLLFARRTRKGEKSSSSTGRSRPDRKSTRL